MDLLVYRTILNHRERHTGQQQQKPGWEGQAKQLEQEGYFSTLVNIGFPGF
jgi:hypothetical protein